MANNAKVSVIIPAYNVEEYLRECLDSLLRQSLKDLEVVIVDDGSTDRTAEIAIEASSEDCRIRYFHQENSGAGVARNKGIFASSGEYIFFLDADDEIPNCCTLESLYDKAKETEAKIVGGSLLIILGDNTYVDESFRFLSNEFVPFEEYQNIWYYQRFLFDRSFLLEQNIVFPSYRRFQDPPFLLDALSKAEVFFSIAEPTYSYRFGHQSLELGPIKIVEMLQGVEHCLNVSRNKGYGRLEKDLLGYFLNNLSLQVSLTDRASALAALPYLEKILATYCNGSFSNEAIYRLAYSSSIGRLSLLDRMRIKALVTISRMKSIAKPMIMKRYSEQEDVVGKKHK